MPAINALVVTGSRADRNGLEVVHRALLNAGHRSKLADVDCDFADPEVRGDVAIVGGDRHEILSIAVELAYYRVPIAHIAGGDITEDSADDRYRDAITAVSCIHFATNDIAFNRLTGGDYDSGPLVHKGDKVYMTGSPAIDRIKQTSILSKAETFRQIGMHARGPTALVCVHPNTVGHPFVESEAVIDAVESLQNSSEMQCIFISANADSGGDSINRTWQTYCDHTPRTDYFENVSPQMYYSLMAHCDVMIGNSSAMLYEAPSFGLPCVLVGDRQRGRTIPHNVARVDPIATVINCIARAQIGHGRFDCDNPYGDGQSAPRIVKALEDNAWLWSSKALETVS